MKQYVVTLDNGEEKTVEAESEYEAAQKALTQVPAPTQFAQTAEQDSRQYDEQIYQGAIKRLQEMYEGVKGAGLRAGSAIGLTAPETLENYEQEIAQRRSVMSPTYQNLSPQTPLEYLGSAGVDISTMYGLGTALKPAQTVLGSVPRIGPKLGSGTEYVSQSLVSPRTMGQAALGGALYSQTIPYTSGGEAAQSAAIAGGVGAGLQPVLRAIGLAPQPTSELSPAQQQAAKRAIEAGFQFTPAQMTGSKTGMFIEEGIKALPLARGAYEKLEKSNQAALQKIAAESIGLKKGYEFTADAMQDAYNIALNKYKTLESVPFIKLDKGFQQQVDSIVAKLDKVPEAQRQQLGIPEIQKVLKEYRAFGDKAVDGETLFLGLRAINDSLFAAQKQGAVGAGAFKDLRNYVENAIERAITAPSKKNIVSPNVVKQFKEGRSQLSNWFTVNEAFNPATGEISGTKLASSLARKSNFGGRNTELETAALAVRAFPRALPSSGTAERAESASLVKQLSAASALPLMGGGATSMLGGSVGDVAAAAGASQVFPAAVANIATSEPVRSIIARRQLGAIAPDEGVIARAFREYETRIPQEARFGAGNISRLLIEQNRIRGLLGE
jgi:hypothetical protein